MNRPKGKKEKKPQEEFMVDLFDKIYNKDTMLKIPKTNRKKKGNVFASYRPKPGHCIDYNISQTDAKLDAGVTQLSLQQTKATYVPVPPEDIPQEVPVKKKRILYSHAGPPVWEFIDEKWRRQNDIIQCQRLVEMKRRIKARKKKEREEFLKFYNKVLTKVGPEWFQELSPDQLANVDGLKRCLEKDIRDRTAINTKDNVARLGLVLRPNSKKIEKALQLCSHCPVEFLLILYQLLEPDRTKYSLNDRLLLSAVVHLTVTETMREMHVRIPSPPGRPKKKENPPKKPKPPDFESPYLVPYTFKKEPRKFTGIYYDKHVQLPESPYFSYLPLLRKDMMCPVKDKVDECSPDRREREIFSEIKLAQGIYNAIHKQKSRRLIPPKVFRPCIDVPRMRKIVYPVAKRKIYQNVDLHDTPIPVHLDVEVTVTTEYDENEEAIGKTCSYSVEYSEKPETNPPQPDAEITQNKCEVNVGGDQLVEADCDKCICGPDKIVEKQCQIATYERCGPEMKVTNKKETNIQAEEPGPFVSAHDDEPKPPVKLPFIKSTSSCKEKALQQIEAQRCSCPICEEWRKQDEAEYIISGLKETSSGQKIPIISGAIGEKVCPCMHNYMQKIDEMEQYRRRIRAREELKQQPNRYVINGVVSTSNGPVYNICGVQPIQECACGKAIREQKEEEERTANLPQAPKGRVKYGIEGVKETPEGNVYILSSAKAIDPCECERLYEQFIQKHGNCVQLYEDYLKQVQQDCQEYNEEMKIAIKRESMANDAATRRVAKMETGESVSVTRLFVMKTDEHIEACKPMLSMGRLFLIGHDSTLECSLNKNQISYTRLFLRDDDDGILTRAMLFLLDDDMPDVDNVVSMTKLFLPESLLDDENVVSATKLFILKGHYESSSELVNMATVVSGTQLFSLGERVSIDASVVSTGDLFMVDAANIEMTSMLDEDFLGGQTVDQISVNISVKDASAKCEGEQVAAEVTEPKDSVGDEVPPSFESDIDLTITVENANEISELKRFTILKKIPCDPKQHRKMIKKTLKYMAEDGYPLAKLPNSHMLPHFRLWMQMRCGMSWDKEDIVYYTLRSLYDWQRIGCCHKTIRQAKLAISKDDGDLLTWRHFAYVNEMVSELKTDRYRKIRQNQINYGRIYFPTMYQYEFPSKYFRDCFFAYTPAKEEESFPYNVWQNFEIKNILKRKSCLCKK